VAIAVNPDVDAVNVGVVGLGGRVLAHQVTSLRSVPSPREAAEIAAEAATTLLRSLGRRRVVGVGVAVPGLVQQGTGRVVRAPHLGWADEPVVEAFTTALELPVAVGNDAALGLIAETRFGAGRGIEDLIYLNGSASGIGGAALVGGRLLTGSHGYAGEFGHMLVDSGGRLCDCGRRGCLEAEVNVQRLDAAAGVGEHEPGAYDEVLSNLSPSLDAEVERQADVLATAMANLAGMFNPEVITLGGFLGAVVDAHRADVVAKVRERAFRPLADDLVIERTRLRETLLLVGAAELAFESLIADPLGVVA
jgi:predicted NBD/HSP70 family sugar kinase